MWDSNHYDLVINNALNGGDGGRRVVLVLVVVVKISLRVDCHDDGGTLP